MVQAQTLYGPRLRIVIIRNENCNPLWVSQLTVQQINGIVHTVLSLVSSTGSFALVIVLLFQQVGSLLGHTLEFFNNVL